MDVRACGRSRHSASKGDKGNTRLAQIIQQRLAFRAVRLERHVHGIVMIEVQAVVSRSLTQCADR